MLLADFGAEVVLVDKPQKSLQVLSRYFLSVFIKIQRKAIYKSRFKNRAWFEKLEIFASSSRRFD
jgi:hypothetical protein